MAKDEDVLPETYQYSWPSDSNIHLHEFLTKARMGLKLTATSRPSMVQNDGTKPWIWVKGSELSQEDQNVTLAIKEAASLLKDVTEKVESIKNDPAIPTRSNKKTGAKSKKELREQTQAEASEKLKEVSVRHGYVSGKWLIFASTDNVDKIWSNLATSLVSGPLASTCAYLTKVATCPEESANYQHVLCLYMPNVYDKDAVTEVMRILLRNHGLNLTGVKSNLYTSIGIDSKHASGISSTIWKTTALLKDAEIRELKDAFFADLKDKPAAPEEEASKKQQDTANLLAAPSKPKLKPKKKAEDDPFASDDDDDGEEEKRKVELKTKKAAAVKGKRAKECEEEGEEEEEERPKRKRVQKK